jgi:hypothetical protein
MKNGEQYISWRLHNKFFFQDTKAIDIIKNERFLNGFSPVDAKIIYELCLLNNQLQIVNISMHREQEDTFIIKLKNESDGYVNDFLLDEIDNDFIRKLKPEDALMLGYMQGKMHK